MTILPVARLLDHSANRSAKAKPIRTAEMLRMMLPPSFLNDLPLVSKISADDNSVYHKSK
jgi:hypothetical protein